VHGQKSLTTHARGSIYSLTFVGHVNELSSYRPTFRVCVCGFISR